MKYVTTINGKQFEIDINSDGSLLVNGEARNVDFRALDPAVYSLLRNDSSYELVIDDREGEVEVLMRGRLYNAQVLDERAQLMAQRSGGTMTDNGEAVIKAPMPGLIVAVKVEAGQAITAGQTVVILESMKMQNELKAPRDGFVNQIHISDGQSVEQGKVLVTITEPTGDD